MIRDLDGNVDIVALLRDARERADIVHLIPAGHDRAESLASFASAMSFPEWFGGNLDALADSLDEAVRVAGGTVWIIWDGVTGLEEDDPDGYAGIRSVLDDLVVDHPQADVVVVHRW